MAAGLFAAGCGATPPADRAASAITPLRTKTMSDAPAAAHALYLGRFAFTAPAGLTGTLDEAHVDEVQIQSTPWPTGMSGPKAWAARLHAIEADSVLRPRGVPAAVIAQRTPVPGSYLLYRYASAAIPTARVAEALIDRGPHSVQLMIPYAPGFEQQVADAVAELARAYVPHDAADGHPATAPGFHLPRGAFAVPFRSEESLIASLDMRRWGFDAMSVTMDTRVDADASEPGLIAEWRAKAGSAAAASMGVRTELLRAQRRVVAGMDGEEIIARSAGAGETPSIVFEWVFRGDNGNPTRPHFRIRASATATDARPLTTTWDAVLSGVRPLAAQ